MTYKHLLGALALAVIGSAACGPAFAGDAAIGSQNAYLFTTLLLLISGVLVMFMAAGFTMLEAGSVRTKSVAVILTKNVALYALTGAAFFLVGYNLMFADWGSDFIGTLAIWSADDSQAVAGDPASGHPANAFWFFQMVFAATAASIVSGAVAERIKLWPFLAFVAILVGVIYPTVGFWTWGGGWLADLGFADFAGSTIVHSVGGWAALAGAILLGARRGRFGADGKATQLPGTSTPQIALGVMILWFGWFGFNGGSQLAFASISDAVAVANIFANTNSAAGGGVLAALVATHLLNGKPNLVTALNGALAGLVAITAEPSAPGIGASFAIGAVGALVMIAASAVLEKLRIDDVVGAVPVHLAAGIWGTLIAGVTNAGASVWTQFLGISAIGGFVFATALVVWFVLKHLVGIRLAHADEERGADLSEMGITAYNFDGPAAATLVD